MKLDTRPLLDTAADAKLFINRGNEVDRLHRALSADLNVVIFGERGVGKSSLLRHVGYRLREEGEPVVIVDAGLATDVGELLVTIQDAIGSAPHLGELLQEGVQRAIRPRGVVGNAVAAVRRLDVGRRLILMIDNLASPEMGYAFFGRLRDELWKLPHTWALTASDSDRMQLLAPPADAFFAASITLDPLDPQAARELLIRRGCDPPVAEVLGGSGEGNPRALLDDAREVALGGVSPSQLVQRRAGLDHAVSQLSRPAIMLWQELHALGSAAASDEDLLGRLGWTRTRATQVLRELEERGLVTVHDERSSRGRPRRVYTPVATPPDPNPVWE